MKIHSLRLKNYKSIEDSGEIFLNRKFNVFAGKNNAGKTALIESLYLFFQDSNLGTPNIKGDSGSGNGIRQETHSIMEMICEIKEDDFLETFRGLEIESKFKFYKITLHSLKGWTSIIAVNGIIDEVETTPQEKEICTWEYINNNYRVVNHMFQVDLLNQSVIPDYIRSLFQKIRNTLLYISSSRTIPAQDSTALHQHLNVTASNIHAFFHTLHNNREEVFDKIQETFTGIFSDVKIIRTTVGQSNSTTIHLEFEGENQLFPLNECGSGYSHVLIMLSVLISETNKIVLFDEPHLYLHPSAEKAIYDLTQQNESHQFIFTTHSPILINYPVSKNLYLVTKKAGKSNYSLIGNVQEILNEIGISNSDFALADKVLFVEGETEEVVIPLILSTFGMKQIGYNYRVLKLQGTGKDFSNKGAMSNNSQKLGLILGYLSSSPIPYRILIDRDEKSEQKINELQETYGDNILILERREIENYFLTQIEPLVLSISQNIQREVSGSEVKEFITKCYENFEDRKLYPKERLSQVNDIVGSEVLERLFNNYQLTYSKVRHGTLIVNWLLENQPNELECIADLLRPFVEQRY